MEDVIVRLSIYSEKVAESLVVFVLVLSTPLVEITVGEVVSTINELTFNVTLVFELLSLTDIEQLE